MNHFHVRSPTESGGFRTRLFGEPSICPFTDKSVNKTCLSGGCAAWRRGRRRRRRRRPRNRSTSIPKWCASSISSSKFGRSLSKCTLTGFYIDFSFSEEQEKQDCSQRQYNGMCYFAIALQVRSRRKITANADCGDNLHDGRRRAYWRRMFKEQKRKSSAHKRPLRLLFGLPIRFRHRPHPSALHRRGYS